MHQSKEISNNRGSFARHQVSFKRSLEATIDKYALDAEFNIEKTCHELLLSRASLYRKILKYYGCSFTDLLMEYRIEKAREYLVLGLSISEVTYKIGYSDPSYFVKIFRKRVGITPGEFRERSNYDVT